MKSFEDIEKEFISSVKESFGNSLAVDTSSNLYKLLYPLMSAVHGRYQQYQTFLDMRNVYKAEGLWLDYLLSNFNFLRKQASNSTVSVKVVGLAGSNFYPGDVIVKTQSNLQFFNTAYFVIPSSGFIYVKFKSIDKGAAYNIPAGSIASTLTSISAISSVINEESAKGGQDRENDFEYRTRFLNNRIGASYWNMNGILKSITSLEGVSSAYLIENDKNVTVNDLPPHSIRIIVDGGDDESIANTIFEKSDLSIEKIGSVEVYVKDINNESRLIRFDRPSIVDILYKYEIDNADSVTVNNILKTYIDSASIHSTLSSLQCMRLIEKSVDLSKSRNLSILFKRTTDSDWSTSITLDLDEKAVGVLYEL